MEDVKRRRRGGGGLKLDEIGNCEYVIRYHKGKKETRRLLKCFFFLYCNRF